MARRKSWQAWTRVGTVVLPRWKTRRLHLFGLVDTSERGEPREADSAVRQEMSPPIDGGVMKVHSFTLVLTGVTEISGEVEDRLFEAGCDDTLLGMRDGVVFLDFDRESELLLDAIVSAISDVEQSGLEVKVIRVEPDDLVTASEIAERTGRSRESIRLLAAGQRGGGGFPPPVRGLKSRMRLWRWAEVIAWMAEHDGTAQPHAVQNAQTIAAVNGALELRRHAPDRTDDLLKALAG